MSIGTEPWSRLVYQEGGWNDGRLGQAYDLIREVLTDRGEKSWKHPLLTEIETLDEEQSA